MTRKKMLNKSSTKAELLAMLNKVATVIWDEMPHEPCSYKDLADTVRRVLTDQLTLILLARETMLHVLEYDEIPQDARDGMELWLRVTRPYEDDPRCHDCAETYRASGIRWYWGDEEEESSL